MAYGTGSNRYLAFIKEVTAGTTPATPTLKKIRNTGGSGITNERSVLQSGEIRSDRGMSDVRLGQNQPALSIPIELAYEAFDDLIAGAFGARWKGGYSVSGTMVVAATTLTLAGTDFSAAGLNVGDYLVISAVTTANNGVYKIKTIGGTGNITLTLDKADGTTPAAMTPVGGGEAVTIRSGYKGGSVNTASNAATVAGTGKTYTMATALWLTTLGLKVGDMVYIAGFSTAGNNGWKHVVTVSDTVLTVAETCTNESLSSGLMDVGSAVGVLITGRTADIQSFTVEEGFTNVTQYHSIKGAKVDKFALSCQPDKMIDGSFDLIGQTYTILSGTTIATAVTEPNSYSPFDSFTGTLSINSGDIDQADAIVSGINIQISNGLNRKFAVMSKDAAAIGEGRVNVTGSLNAFFGTGAPFAVLYNAETEVDLNVRLIDLNSNAYLINIPRLKFTKDGRSISENEVTESLDFQALIHSTTLETARITKQPYA